MNAQSLKLILILPLGLIALAGQASDVPRFALTITNNHFFPAKLEVPAGQKIKLVIKNEGPGPEEFESSDLNREKLIQAGKTAEVTVGPLKPGTYKFYGEFNPKTAQGQIVAQ